MRRHHLSFEHKFLLIILVTSAVAIVSSVAATTLYDARSNKQLLLSAVERSVAFIGKECAPALASGDRASIDATMAALRASTRMLDAQVSDRDGNVVGRYVAPILGDRKLSPILQTNGYRFLNDRLAMVAPVVFAGEEVGSVYVEHDISQYRTSALGSMAFTFTATAGSMIIVILLSWQFRPRFSGPIMELAAVTKKVSRDKNFGLRADIAADDEVGTLVDGFNEMLQEIQTRDAALEHTRQELEREMAVRTAELRDVNARLQDSEIRMRAVIEGTSAMTGGDFFDALSVTLARALNVRWLMIGAVAPGGRIKAQALWDGTRLMRDFSYAYRSTPAERVLADSFAAYKDGVGDLYPEANTLAGWKTQAYVGVALRKYDGGLIGILEAYHDEPMADLARHGALFRVFASRAAAELERILVEGELTKSEARTRAILNSAADGIMTIHASGHVDTLNPAAESMFGYATGAIRGTNVAELLRVPGDDGEESLFKAHPAAVLTAFTGRRGEIEGVRSDGTVFPINVVVTNMQVDEEGGYTAIVRDISRERELDRMKSDFVSTVSHEIRTPLSCIVSSAKILRSQDGASPQVSAKFSRIITEEGERLSRLINDLLDLSKLDTGGLSWTFGETAPADVLEQVASLHREAAAARGLTLNVKVQDDVPRVNVDRSRFVQVLDKLIDNAIKFTEHGGSIDLCAKHDSERFVTISVNDTGIGIAASDHEAVFDRFRQIGDVLTDRPQGTGLGLPICKEIVKNFGGKIWVESTPGQGSSFRFTVPIATMASNRSRDLEASGMPLALVVDDEISARALVESCLASNGFSVTQASDGLEALAFVRKRVPDLIILDILMPGMSGYEVLRALRGDEKLASIPVVLLSLLNDESLGDRALKLGANAYLAKPFEESELVATACKLLGMPAPVGTSRDGRSAPSTNELIAALLSELRTNEPSQPESTSVEDPARQS
jgi:PAS domain S-box-containing protein